MCAVQSNTVECVLRAFHALSATIEPMRWACLVLTLALATCSPGSDGDWTVVERGLLPAELRLVRAGTDGSFWAAGYHAGSLGGLLLQGVGGTISEVSLPPNRLWDHALVGLDEPVDGVLWVAGTADLFRRQDSSWQTWHVPAAVVDGVTASVFVDGERGWIVGQGWDGPHIYRFEDGVFTEESIDADVSGLSLASIVAPQADVLFAAGARLVEPQQGVLLAWSHGTWRPVDLPLAADEVGAIRDLSWHDGELWIVADRILRGPPDDIEVEDVPMEVGFVPRVGAFPDAGERWVAGFGNYAVLHHRYGRWEPVEPSRLSGDLADGTERTWLFDDADFATPENGWLVGAYLDLDPDGSSRSGEALLNYSRDLEAGAWETSGEWLAPPSDVEYGPAVMTTALARAPDGAAWLAGDAAPVDGSWGDPETWRRSEGAWERVVGDLVGVGLHDIEFVSADDGWAVGSEPGDAGDQAGVVLRWDGEEWHRQDVSAVDAADWDLRAVRTGTNGSVFAVGRRLSYGYAVVRDDGEWRTLDIDLSAIHSVLADVDVALDGTVWAVGTTALASGSAEGVLLAGDLDGLERIDVAGRECGPPSNRYPCWTLAAVDAGGDDVLAVGEATFLSLGVADVVSTPTNMTLVDVSRDAQGVPWVVAENGWWRWSGNGWTLHRHWDELASEGFVCRLVKASGDVEVVAGYREWPGTSDEVQSVLVQPDD